MKTTMTPQEAVNAVRALAQDILDASSRWRDADRIRNNCQRILDLPEQVIVDAQGLSLRDLVAYWAYFSFIPGSLRRRKSSNTLKGLLFRAEDLREPLYNAVNTARDALRVPDETPPESDPIADFHGKFMKALSEKMSGN